MEYTALKVTDRKSFIGFLKLLRKDLADNPQAWENTDLNDYLVAMEAFAEAIQGFYDNNNQNIDADEASWQVFADILAGASVYE